MIHTYPHLLIAVASDNVAPVGETQDSFDRIDFEGVTASAERGESREKDCMEGEGVVERAEAQMLLADAGEVMTQLRVSYSSKTNGRKRFCFSSGRAIMRLVSHAMMVSYLRARQRRFYAGKERRKLETKCCLAAQLLVSYASHSARTTDLTIALSGQK